MKTTKAQLQAQIEVMKRDIAQAIAERDAARAETARMEVRALESSIAAAQMRLLVLRMEKNNV